MEEAVTRTLNHLCAMPTLAHSMLTRAEVRQLLQQTGGDVMAQGRLYDIQVTPRGAGMYTVRLRKREYA